LKLLLSLLVVLLITAGLLGPGRDHTAFAVWWVSNTTPPELNLPVPAGAVRGSLDVPVSTHPVDRVEVVAADFAGRPVVPGSTLKVDTGGLPDGEHTLTVRAEDRSWRRNATTATVRIRSDNTPPTFDVEANPARLALGHTTVLFIRPNEPADLQASLDGAPLPLYPAGSDFWTVLGADPDDRPGPREILVEGRDRVGNAGQSTSEITLTEFEFTRDSLQVPPALLPLLQPAVRASEDEQLKAIYQEDNGPPLWKGAFRQPVRGPISTEFGEVRSYNGAPFAGHHGGTDFQVGGGTLVEAPATGRVAFQEEVRLRGRVLVLDHGGGVYTTYAHLEDWLVEVGQEVQQGQQIAKVGSTGLSTGPHLHWELWVGGRTVDPLEWTEREIP
jgi:murein DD-endopeptidase MepM/ murein hydrolase activator NlpD